MIISIENIKYLREKSGAGMVDCKKVLEESEGDIEIAMDLLRKRGIAKAAKRVDREAKEGLIMIGVNENATKGYMAEINAETDFVALSEKFRNFAKEVYDLMVKNEPASLADLFNLKMASGNTVKDDLDSLSGVIGEKLAIKRIDIISTEGTISAYRHLGGMIGVLAAINKPDAKELAYDLAMQIAAANPKCIAKENVLPEDIEREKEIYREQLKNEGKPENMIENIITGKLNKYFEEVCLVEQEYIKDDKKKIKDLLGDVKVEKFIRYSL